MEQSLNQNCRTIEQLANQILKVRFGSTEITPSSTPLLNVKQTAEICGTSQYLVRRVSYSSALNLSLKFLDKYRPKLKEADRMTATEFQQREQALAELSSRISLQLWAHLTLDERLFRINKKYPRAKVNSTTLRKHWRAIGVKKKQITVLKPLKQMHVTKQPQQFLEAQKAIHEAIQRGRRLVWIDQASVSFNTLSTTAWSRRNENVQVYRNFVEHDVCHFCVAVEAEEGMVGFLVADRAFDSQMLKSVLRQIALKIPNAQIIADQASIHGRSAVTRQNLQELSLPMLIETPVASPQLNEAAEKAILFVKTRVKQKKLEYGSVGRPFDVKELTESAIIGLKQTAIKAMIKRTLWRWRQKDYSSALISISDQMPDKIQKALSFSKA